MRTFLKLVLPIAASTGALVASLVLWIACQNNNQGEFYDPLSGRPDWGYDLTFWLAFFVPPFQMVAIPGAIVVWMRAIDRER